MISDTGIDIEFRSADDASRLVRPRATDTTWHVPVELASAIGRILIVASTIATVSYLAISECRSLLQMLLPIVLRLGRTDWQGFPDARRAMAEAMRDIRLRTMALQDIVSPVAVTCLRKVSGCVCALDCCCGQVISFGHRPGRCWRSWRRNASA